MKKDISEVMKHSWAVVEACFTLDHPILIDGREEDLISYNHEVIIIHRGITGRLLRWDNIDAVTCTLPDCVVYSPLLKLANL